MTCIVGIRHAQGVTLGGDSAGVAGLDLVVRRDPKVFTLADGHVVMGFTSSFRMGDLLRYSLKIPQLTHTDDLDRWMRTSFIDAIRKCLKDGGYAENHSSAERGGTFLVGVGGRLFNIASDYQVGESAHDFDSCGCGEPYALGALHCLTTAAPPADATAAEGILRKALTTAVEFSGGVRGPFTFASSKIARTDG